MRTIYIKIVFIFLHNVWKGSKFFCLRFILFGIWIWIFWKIFSFLEQSKSIVSKHSGIFSIVIVQNKCENFSSIPFRIFFPKPNSNSQKRSQSLISLYINSLFKRIFEPHKTIPSKGQRPKNWSSQSERFPTTTQGQQPDRFALFSL